MGNRKTKSRGSCSILPNSLSSIDIVDITDIHLLVNPKFVPLPLPKNRLGSVLWCLKIEKVCSVGKHSQGRLGDDSLVNSILIQWYIDQYIVMTFVRAMTKRRLATSVPRLSFTGGGGGQQGGRGGQQQGGGGGRVANHRPMAVTSSTSGDQDS